MVLKENTNKEEVKVNLKELKDEIRRLNSLKENRKDCTIDIKLEVIKQIVEKRKKQ